MKLTIITLVIGLLTTAVAHTGSYVFNKVGECDREIRLKVVLSESGCTTEPAIYQVFDHGMTRIVCLDQPTNGSNSIQTNLHNTKVIHTILATIDLREYYVKSMEMRSLDSCGEEINYTLAVR